MHKELPHSRDAEQAILGAMMIYPKVITQCIEQGLYMDDFYEDAHKKVYQAILDVHKDGKAVDFRTLITRLTDTNELALVGDVDYLTRLSDSAISGANSLTYVELIKERSHLRRLIEVVENIAEEGFDTSKPLDDVLDSAEKEILNITRDRRGSDFRASSEIVNDLMKSINHKRTLKDDITGIRTSYSQLDKVTNGFQRGDLIVLAARPAMGKTAFALNLARRANSPENGAVALFSLEMPAESLMSRILSAESQVLSERLRAVKTLTSDDMLALVEASNQLRNKKLYIDDSAGVRVGEIFSKCRKLKSEHGLDMVVIDYLQLISGSSNSRESRQQEISEISRSLKLLAREMECPVIALSQLSRSVEQRDNKHPMLSDLRESGAIEQDADIVMFLYRPDYYLGKGDKRAQEADKVNFKDGNEDEIDKTNVTVEIDIAKHRNGETRVIKMGMNLTTSSFHEFAYDAYPGSEHQQ